MVDDFVRRLAEKQDAKEYLRRLQEERMEEINDGWNFVRDIVDKGREGVYALFVPNYYEADNVGNRDLKMERTLRETKRDNPGLKIAGINGIAHLIEDPRKLSLYSSVRDLKPRRVFLYQ